jgi:hypothetical protein
VLTHDTAPCHNSEEDHAINLNYVLIVGALEIDEVRASDQGSYRCNATSLDQYRLSATATLSIDTNLGEFIVTSENL